MIYLMTTKDGRFVKVGYTKNANTLKTRLGSLQVSCPLDLQVSAFGHGSGTQEKAIHKELEQGMVHGEWFDLGNEKVKTFYRYAKRFSPLDALDLIKPDRLATATRAARLADRIRGEKAAADREARARDIELESLRIENEAILEHNRAIEDEYQQAYYRRAGGPQPANVPAHQPHSKKETDTEAGLSS